MPKVKLSFEMSRGSPEINREVAGPEDLAVLDRILALCKEKKSDEAALLVREGLRFSMDWANADSDAAEVFDDTEDMRVELTAANSSVEVGLRKGELLVTASIVFTVSVRDEVVRDELEEWIEENSLHAAGSFSGVWSWWDGWSGSEGEGLRVDEP